MGIVQKLSHLQTLLRISTKNISFTNAAKPFMGVSEVCINIRVTVSVRVSVTVRVSLV